MNDRASVPRFLNVAGTSPVDKPMPLVSKRITSLVMAISWTRAGYQSSVLPQKGCTNTRGTVPAFP